jgi:hypothetical protein
MIDVPKLVVLLLVGFFVWYAMRWVNGAAARNRRRGAPPPSGRQRQQQAIEDLVACRVCGAYIAAGAPACGRSDCPQPR